MRRAAPLPALPSDSALASRASAGMLGRNETQIGHELPRIGETGDVAEFRHQRRRGHQREATQRLQRLHHWRQRPIRQRGFDVGFKMIPPSRRRLDGRDAIFQHDVMRCVFERQSGEPAPVHQGPGRPGYNDGHGAAGKPESCWRACRNTRTAASRARTRSRIASWAGGLRNPHRRQFTRSVQFGQVSRVASVGFDPIARLAPNQRRGDHDALVSGFAQLALNAVTARTGLIAKSKAPAMTSPASPCQSPQRRRRCSRSCHARAAPPRLPASASATAIVSLCTSRPT